MKRLAWLIVAAFVMTSAFTARQIYPAQKWWMRVGYVKAFHIANWITGNDFSPPDRFK